MLAHIAMMWPYHPELLAGNVPRYTSYPTAAEFHDGVGAAEMAQALSQIGEEEAISLYLHIPYCQQICWYCGCNTGAAGRTQRLTSYLAALEAEIATLAAKLDGRGRVAQIAFGGGSPNAIAPVEFVRLVDRLLTMFAGHKPQISVEVDPRIFSLEWASTLAHCGVSRVSLGVQSFSDTIQRAIGRIQPLSMIETCMAQLRNFGIQAINFDLMYGLPGQSADDLCATLETAVNLGPSRIALFGYAHMPHLFPRQRQIDDSNLPHPDERFAMAETGYQRLTQAGYTAIGFDHFACADDSLAVAAQKGNVRRNFQGFTDDGCETMIGIGASAISHFPGYIIQNEKNPGRYRMLASASHLTASRGVKRTIDDRLRGQLIADLLCTGRCENVPSDIQDQIRFPMEPFVQHGLTRMDDGVITITASGLPYSRAIASCLDAYRPTGSTQFSQAI